MRRRDRETTTGEVRIERALLQRLVDIGLDVLRLDNEVRRTPAEADLRQRATRRRRDLLTLIVNEFERYA
jgi:hypothetical protein